MPAANGKLAVVLLSGGLDSATVLALARAEGFVCHALSFDYGQRHREAELRAARRLAGALGAAEHRIVQIDLTARGGFGHSALTDEIAVPKDRDTSGAVSPVAGASVAAATSVAAAASVAAVASASVAAAPQSRIENPKSQISDLRSQISDLKSHIPVTYVPARNTIFLSLALGYAEVLGAFDLFIGVNAIDYSGYPDCRPAFVAAFEAMANLATAAAVEGRGRYEIRAPLIRMSKAEIIRAGLALGVDYSLTHSCYDPSSEGLACGRCDSCRLRRAGFAQAGVADPTRYQQG